ncbi:uncharacterized protein PV06_08387 [Exophiala oligosperma]|uniref:Uncharacterized protein n=1 Tax=Exophiala oligosperma TaxID=215243 RepID=A0A0D2BQL4_9EURO|nr:uncharacterized protein PV06_08387 [Exophiala oligosperma]KIW39802.1 hypothetical protein PV06_08387 [Exophiala oligosperma]
MPLPSRLSGPRPLRRAIVTEPACLPFARPRRRGCLRCKLVVGGIDKFEYFWKGEEEEEEDDDDDRTTTWPEGGIKDDERYETLRVGILLSFSPTVTNLKNLTYRLCPDEQIPPPFPGSRPAGHVPKRSDSEPSFTTIRTWIDKCESQHDLCHMPQTPNEMPARLVCVGEDGDDPRTMPDTRNSNHKIRSIESFVGIQRVEQKARPKDKQ